MTRTIGGPTRLSQAGNRDRKTGGIQRIHGLENSGAESPQNSLEKQIETIVQDALNILKGIKAGTEKHLSFKNFTEIAEGIRLRLVEVGLSTQKIDDAIAEAQRRISER